MGIVRGIKAIQEATAPRESVEYVKATWLKLKDGDDVTLRFVNELDADSPSYDVGRGLAVVVDEHQPPGPEGFKRHALCTMESQGKCWACEQVAVDKKWRSKQKFYINVLIDDGKNDPYVALWAMGTYRNDKFTMIKDHFVENNSISNLSWRLKRTGVGVENTSYTFYPKQVDTKPFKWPEIEPFDIEAVLRDVPYAEQARFYGFGNAEPTEELKGSQSVEW